MKEREKTFVVNAEKTVSRPGTISQIFEVSACNQEKAAQLCSKQLEENGMNCVSISRKQSAWPGIIMLGITVLLSFINFFAPGGFDYISLFPGINAMIFSCALYAGFVIRVKGLDNSFKDFPDVLISVLFITVLAMYINVFSGTARVKTGLISDLFMKLGISRNYLVIIAAIILSWIGLKQISCFVWLVVVLLSLIELSTCGYYMGNYISWLFVMSSFLGFVMYLKYEERAVRQSIYGAAALAGKGIKSQLDSSRQVIAEIKNRTGAQEIEAQKEDGAGAETVSDEAERGEPENESED